jgi:hypothetical protein
MKTMAEAGKEYTFTNEEGQVDYTIEIPEGDFLLVSMGAERGNSAAKFDHHNILRTQKQILSFRAYWPNGHKRWYEKPGVDFLMAFPKDKIYMVHERGYSYPRIEINGVKLCLNVSGGTSKDGWKDYVYQGSSIGVFRSKRKMEKIAEASFVPEDLDLGPVRVMDEREYKSYMEMCAYHDTKGKLKIGDKIVLGYGYNIEGSKGPFEIVNKPKRKRHFICSFYPTNFRAYYKHINWEETAKVNGIALAS